MPPFRLPRTVALELTYRCNHQCIFCSCPWFFEGNHYPVLEELTVKQWIRAIDILYDNGIDTFSVSGGEVLLKEGFEDILRYIRDAGHRRGCCNEIVLISNGLAMSEAYLELFRELDIHLSMSLPGYETFYHHTGVDNADGVLYWFRRAKELGVETTVNVTVTQKNLHELFRTVALGIINGADDVLVNRFLPGGRGLKHQKELNLTLDEVNEMLTVAEDVLRHANTPGSVGTEIARCAVRVPSQYRQLRIGYTCAAAKAFFVVDPAGRIRVCNHSPRVVGNVFDSPLISDVDYWNTFAESRHKPEGCKAFCPDKDLCDCGCREAANILCGFPSALDVTLFR